MNTTYRVAVQGPEIAMEAVDMLDQLCSVTKRLVFDGYIVEASLPRNSTQPSRHFCTEVFTRLTQSNFQHNALLQNAFSHSSIALCELGT